jgi:hypothetical protein
MLTVVPKCAARRQRLAAGCLIAAVLLGCTDATPRDSRDASPPQAAGMDAGQQTPDSGRQTRDAGQLTGNMCGDETYPIFKVMLFESPLGAAAQSGSELEVVSYEAQTITGIVQAHGDGFPTFAAPLDYEPPADPEQFKYLRIADGSRELTIAARGLPDWGVREGTQVQLSLEAGMVFFYTLHAALMIRAGSELAFFFGAEVLVERLSSDTGFAFRRAGLACETQSECGIVGSYELGVTPAGGDELLLGPGEAREVDGLRIAHLATHASLAPTGKCVDYFPETTRLTISRPTAISPPPFTCEITEQSALPGVHIRLPSDTVCQYTLAQARAGIVIPYSVSVDHDIEGFASEPLDIGHCEVPDPGVFGTFEQLSGNAQFYARADVGGCFGQALRPGTLRKGDYSHNFEWDGRNWRGPSDTGEPKGAPFPAGIYTLTIRAQGYSDITGADAGSGDPFAASATLRVLLRD